jgi:hypothetical protein
MKALVVNKEEIIKNFASNMMSILNDTCQDYLSPAATPADVLDFAAMLQRLSEDLNQLHASREAIVRKIRSLANEGHSAILFPIDVFEEIESLVAAEESFVVVVKDDHNAEPILGCFDGAEINY